MHEPCEPSVAFWLEELELLVELPRSRSLFDCTSRRWCSSSNSSWTPTQRISSVPVSADGFISALLNICCIELVVCALLPEAPADPARVVVSYSLHKSSPSSLIAS